MKFNGLAIILALIVNLTSVFGSEVVDLQADRVRLLAEADSLEMRQNRLQADLNRLAAKIDRLKGPDKPLEASGILAGALQEAMTLTLALEAIYQAQESIQSRLDRRTDDLKVAYDREIGQLIGQLTDGGGTTIARLQALQKAKAALQETVRDTMAVSILSIREDDGPEQLRQKADLMADMANHVREEVLAADRAISRLEEEKRLRGRMAALIREMVLFDEHLPEGRSVRLQVSEQVVQVSEEDLVQELPPVASIGAADVGSAETTLRGPAEEEIAPLELVVTVEVVAEREVVTVGQGEFAGGLVLDPIDREIRILKGRKEALMGQEERLKAQVITFRERLKELLGENEQ
ncbi:MAG: hypothetical protein O7G87_16770 [bacterium]|nr:hypothetical protein [bacterium]